MYAIVRDISNANESLLETSLGEIPVMIDAAYVADDPALALSSAPFYFEVLASTKRPEGFIFRVVDTTPGSFTAWQANNPWAEVATTGELDVELSNVSSVFPWRKTRFFQKRSNEAQQDSPTTAQALADNPAPIRVKRFAEVDTKTRQVIADGFAYNAKQFSLSDNAQRTFLGMYVTRASETYPIPISTIDDLDVELLADSIAVEAFYADMSAAIRAALVGGVTLKQALVAAATEADVLAVSDNR